MKTAVIIPTWSRVEQAVLCTHRLLATSSADAVIVTEDCIDDFGDLIFENRVMFVEVTPRMTAVQKWNYGLECHPSYDAYVLGADDLWMHDDWHNEALRVQQTTGCGFIGINDGQTDGSHLSTHYMMTKDFIVHHHGGVMAIPHYRSWGVDEEASLRAKNANEFAYAEHAIAEHRHWAWGKSKLDQTYSSAIYAQKYDEAILRMREAHGFPNDFQEVI